MDTAVVDNLRGTANFVRRYGRMPASVGELEEGMGLVEPFPIAEEVDGELRRHLRQWDAVLDFHRRHGRLPRTSEEIPPAE
jgi:hypothetical protein